MNLVLITYILFLAIFTASAVIALLALIRKITVKPQYEKKLFQSLIIGVIGVVINFITMNILSTNEAPLVSDHMLLDNHWDWSVPENSWKTDISFEKAGDTLVLNGKTNRWKNGKKIAVMEWQSIEPVKTPVMGKELQFRARMKYLYGELEFDSSAFKKGEIDKWREGRINLKTDISLKGVFKPDGSSSEPWGMLINRAWQ